MAASSINWLLALLKKPDWLVLVVMALILVLEIPPVKIIWRQALGLACK
jgi:hypothetical protein